MSKSPWPLIKLSTGRRIYSGGFFTKSRAEISKLSFTVPSV